MKNNVANEVRNEEFYERGQRQAYMHILRDCLRFLGIDAPTGTKRLVARVIEREEAVLALRRLCEEFGDNDWPDNLALSDIIEKHLAYHLRSRAESFDAEN